MNLWHRQDEPWQEQNLDSFRSLMRNNPDVTFFFPNFQSSPWHVQAVFHGETLNFWPHLLKGNIDRRPAVVGYEALEELIESLRNSEDDELEVIEDVETED